MKRCGFLFDKSGVALTEFALGAPFLLFFGLWGIETANLAISNMRVSQIASQIGDNASRIGDTSSLKDRRIYEADINDLLYGAELQAGQNIQLYTRGRVVISSVEVDPSDGRQYIHWQRCMGMKAYVPPYGSEGSKLSGGIGPVGNQVTAEPDDAVIFVEVHYDYKPLISTSLSPSTEIVGTATFQVRDERDLSQIYQAVPAKPDPVARCSRFDANTNPPA